MRPALLLLAGCLRPLPDPLAEQRKALAHLPAPAAGWAPQASLVVARAGLEDGIEARFNSLLARGLAGESATVFGVTASMAPVARVSELHLDASSACETCLGLSLKVVGKAHGRLGNGTGSREADLDFSGTLTGVLALGFDGQRVTLRPEAPDAWAVTMAWDALPTGINQLLTGMLSRPLQEQLLLSDLPAFPLIELRGAASVPVVAFRLRPDPKDLVVDFAFKVPKAGVVVELPGVAQGWSFVMPQETALGLMTALMLAEPYDPEAQATPELTDLTLDGDRFALDLRAWPTRGRNRPRDIEISGSFGLAESGEIFLKGEEAHWVKDRGAPPELAAVLFGGRVLDGLGATVSSTLPGTVREALPGVTMVATTTSVVAVSGVMVVSGGLTLGE